MAEKSFADALNEQISNQFAASQQYIGAAVYYVSRADLEHAQGLLVVAAALAALVRAKLFGAAVLALLIVVGAANRTSALLRPPDLGHRARR